MLLGLAAACAAPPAPSGDTPMKEIIRKAGDPKTAYQAFSTLLREGKYAKAHLMLSIASRNRISQEEFVLAMTNFEEVRRMMIEARVHALDVDGLTGTMRVCNPEFRLTNEYPIVKEAGVYWTFDLSRDEIEMLTDRVLGWYGERTDDGVRHVYPAGYPHPAARRRCDCGIGG